MPAVINIILIIQNLSNLIRIRTAVEDLVSKGARVEEIEDAIRANGLPVLPEVHAILVEVERSTRTIVQ